MKYLPADFTSQATMLDESPIEKRKQRELINCLMALYPDDKIQRVRPTADQMLEGWAKVTPYNRMKQWKLKQQGGSDARTEEIPSVGSSESEEDGGSNVRRKRTS